MKRIVFTVLFALAAVLAAWSQPKIAVLDSIIPQNMDPSVIVPSTEKIIERLVVSGRFTVLDRANIESVLKEREFQVSGMVSDQDVVTAGKYLGADFVVVAKISKVGDTFFISAKMINIKTGVIANQTSAQGEGKISTLIDLAGQVGEVLSGGAVTAQSSAGTSSDISKPAEKKKEKPKEKPATGSGMVSPFNSAIVVGLSYVPTVWTENYSMTYNGVTTTNLDNISLDIGYERRYLMLNVSIGTQTSGTYKDVYNGATASTSDIKDKLSYLGIGLYGKLPFTFGNMVVFPFAGIEYLANISIKDSGGNDIIDSLNAFGKSIYNDRLFAELGAGIDLNIGEKYFARGSFTFGYKVLGQADTDYINAEKAYYATYTSGSITTLLYKGQIAFGYRF